MENIRKKLEKGFKLIEEMDKLFESRDSKKLRSSSQRPKSVKKKISKAKWVKTILYPSSTFYMFL